VTVRSQSASSHWLLGARLADCLGGRDNHLNLIRMVAAAAVLVSHAYAITIGSETAEPLVASTGTTLGFYAVAVFFAISGLLIARSFDRHQHLGRFVSARILRLYPALVVALILTVLGGAALSQLDPAAYFSRAATWTYVPRGLSLAFLQHRLPGLFLDNPFSPGVNGSLWTLFYEVACYALVVVVGMVGLLRSRPGIAVLLVAVTAAHIHGLTWAPADGIAYRLDLLSRIGFAFALGTAAYVWRDRIHLGPGFAAALWVGALTLSSTFLFGSAITVALAYTVFWLGMGMKGPLLAYNRLGDYSYGVYIYAFPIQQAVMQLGPGQSPIVNIAISMPLTLIMAVLSWHLIEERSLALVSPFGEVITRLWPRWARVPRVSQAG